MDASQIPAAPAASATSLVRHLLATSREWTPLVLRLSLGAMIFPHGAQKLLGWFGGFGFTGTMGFFTDTMGLPYVLGLLAIVAEFFGGIALLAGALTRVAAFGVGTTMLVAALTSHVQHGFFMNWFGAQEGEGVEFFVLAVGIAAALVASGGGRYSVDRALILR